MVEEEKESTRSTLNFLDQSDNMEYEKPVIEGFNIGLPEEV